MGYPFSCSTSCTNAVYDTFAPGAIGEMGLHYTKLEEMARSAVIPTIDYAKTPRSRRNEQSIPPPMKNERLNAQRNLLKREQSKPEHNSPKRYIEVATNSLHRIQATYISINRGSLHPPRRSGSSGWMRWSPEDGEGGLRRVLLPRPLVRRKATMKSTRAMRYSALEKPIQTI